MILQGSSSSARIFDGEGPLWVALHGLMDSSAAWNNQNIPGSLLAPDLPGWGGTPGVPGQTDIWVDWLRQALREYGVSDFYMIGHSLGGGLALAAAEKLQPRGILLLAPLGIGVSRLPGTLLRARPLLGRGAHHAMRVPFLTNAVYHTFFSQKKMPKDLRKRINEHSEAIVRGSLEAMPVVEDLSKRTPLWGGPVEILWGKQDRILRLQADRLQGLPGAQLQMLDCGHDIPREDPRAISEAACRLLGR